MAKLWNRRDVEFLLFDVLKVQELSRFERFQDHDVETYKMILDAAEQLAHEEYLPTNSEGDRHGTKYQDGKVTVPESFRKLKNLFVEGGWMTLTESAEEGGQQVPHVVGMIGGCVFGSGNHAFSMFPGLSLGAANLIRNFGTERQKKLYMEPIMSLKYGGTMCLTEAQAGSDVGNLSTVARRNPDGTFSIKGTKIFISWGDHDLSENIIHPVLARIEGDPAGTKGISIFLVPKYRVNEDGSQGKLNDVQCTGVEHKLGIHASPTCQLTFGENDNCIGELLGVEREGMKIMFQMMNGARLETGMQGLTQSEPAYLYALDYCLDRKQGSSLKDFKNPEAPRAAIIEHPNVRLLLMDMKAKTEGMRALLGYVAMNLDISHVASDEAERDRAQGVVEVLIPIVKAWCTDVGFKLTEEAIQCLGGHGYLQDHPLEQYMRDIKIASLYEGTNEIQAIDLLGRKLMMKNGAYFMNVLGKLADTANDLKGIESLKAEAASLDELRGLVMQTAMNLGQTFRSGNLDLPLLNAKSFLDSMGDVVVAWLLLWEAKVAHDKLEALFGQLGVGEDGRAAVTSSHPEAAFLNGKILSAKYFAARVLPLAKGRLTVVNASERTALDVKFSEAELAIAAQV